MRGGQVRRDTLTVPAGLSRDEVQALAEQHAQSQVTGDEIVSFVHLHGSRPVDSAEDQRLWRYSYHVTTRGPAN